MPIEFDLESLRQKYSVVNYLETGLYDPRRNVSIRKALASDFRKVYSLELRKEWVTLGEKAFQKDLSRGRLTLLHMDSNDLQEVLVGNPDFEERTLFFFDAHVDNAEIHGFRNLCPLLHELQALECLTRKDHIICIDDVRILRHLHPWGEQSYGKIDFLSEIQKRILSLNSKYTFSYLPGYCADDVMIAIPQ
jgi:hypothetical protein